MSRRRVCVFCADIIDSNADGVYELVRGWAKIRKSGTNAVALEQRLNLFACGLCIDKQKKGISPGQQTLFVVPDE